MITPRLEIRAPADEDLFKLLDVIEHGVHEPGTMPFLNPWTLEPRPERDRNSLRWWWGARANFRPESWTFVGAIFVDGEPIGVQDLMADQFPDERIVRSGSWLGRRYQGRGLGKEMRAAILHLAFDGLGARLAQSGAYVDNAASNAVSRHFGYRVAHVEEVDRLGEKVTLQRFELTREEWLPQRRDDIVIEGLDACRSMFGATRT